QQQRGLSDPGLAPDQHDGSRHDAAAEDIIELGEPRAPARGPRAGPEGGQADGWTAGRNGAVSVRPSGGPPDRLFHEGIPRPAGVAAARPFRLLGPAVGAAEYRMRPSHGLPRG